MPWLLTVAVWVAPWVALVVLIPILRFCTGQLNELSLDARLEQVIEDVECPVPVVTVRAVADRFGLDPHLLIALALQESTCRADAVGPSGSLGLLQLRPATARDVAGRHGIELVDEESLFEVELNLEIGAAHLSELHLELGDWEAALAAYNLGLSRYRSLDRSRRDFESSYAKRVLERWDELARLSGSPQSSAGLDAVGPPIGMPDGFARWPEPVRSPGLYAALINLTEKT